MCKESMLWLIWQNSRTRQKYHVGNLSHDGKVYRFNYAMNGLRTLEDALADGYRMHVSFPEKYKVYESENLFPPFARRLPDRRRPDFQEILENLGLPPDYTLMDLLKATGGKQATDTYEFVTPVMVYGFDYHFDFDIHGWRYYDGENVVQQLSTGEELLFQSEPTNKKDPYAVKVLTKDGKHLLGYVPSFYSPFVTQILNGKGSYHAKIEKINPLLGTARKVSVAVTGSLTQETGRIIQQDVIQPFLYRT
mgnify:CR=1 FL=1